MRRFLLCLGMIALATTMSVADELKGKLKDVDALKRIITVTVDGKERTFPVAEDAKITTTGKGKAPGADVIGGLLGVKAGGDVAITTQNKDGKEVVTALK